MYDEDFFMRITQFYGHWTSYDFAMYAHVL